MDREGGYKERMRKFFLHFLILSPFPLRFLFISSFSLHFLAARLQGCNDSCGPEHHWYLQWRARQMIYATNSKRRKKPEKVRHGISRWHTKKQDSPWLCQTKSVEILEACDYTWFSAPCIFSQRANLLWLMWIDISYLVIHRQEMKPHIQKKRLSFYLHSDNSCVARVQSENSVINSRFCSYCRLFPFLGTSSWINSYIQDLFLEVFWLISIEGNFFLANGVLIFVPRKIINQADRSKHLLSICHI